MDKLPLVPAGAKVTIGVAKAAFNHECVDEVFTSFKDELDLLATQIGFKYQLQGLGSDESVIVPGSLELAHALRVLAASDSEEAIDALVAFGCVIRGDTSHYDLVCRISAQSLQDASNELGIAVINAVLTCNDLEQAQTRAASKGRYFARAALAMARVGRVYQGGHNSQR